MLIDFNLKNYSDILTPPHIGGDFSSNYSSMKSIEEAEQEEGDTYSLKPKEIYDTLEDYHNWFQHNNPLFSTQVLTPSSRSQKINLDISKKDLEKILENSTLKVKSGVDLSDLSPEIRGLIQVLHQLGVDATITSARRNGATTSHGTKSRHSEGQAIDIVPSDRKNYSALNEALSSDLVQSYLTQYKLGVLDETSQEMMQRTGAAAPHYHIGPDVWGRDIAMKFN